MSALKDEIRAVLREEIAAILAEETASDTGSQIEKVRISSSAELNRFVQELVRRASDPNFAASVTRGEWTFDLDLAPAMPSAPIVSGPRQAEPARVVKPLVAERDIADLEPGSSLLVTPSTRLTPLALDEARRRGIRIERAVK